MSSKRQIPNRRQIPSYRQMHKCPVFDSSTQNCIISLYDPKAQEIKSTKASFKEISKNVCGGLSVHLSLVSLFENSRATSHTDPYISWSHGAHWSKHAMATSKHTLSTSSFEIFRLWIHDWVENLCIKRIIRKCRKIGHFNSKIRA
jgi:hypothetical protein